MKAKNLILILIVLALIAIAGGYALDYLIKTILQLLKKQMMLLKKQMKMLKTNQVWKL
jgi:hypothetical protein